MNQSSRKKRVMASVAGLSTAAILVILFSLQTTLTKGGVAYAQEEEFTLKLTIDSVSWDPRTKQVTVDFTAICPEPGDGSWHVEVTQSRGGKVISGDLLGVGELACDEEGVHLSATIEADEGLFVPGPALVRVVGVACGVFDCDDDVVTEEVRLSPRG